MYRTFSKQLSRASWVNIILETWFKIFLITNLPNEMCEQYYLKFASLLCLIDCFLLLVKCISLLFLSSTQAPLFVPSEEITDPCFFHKFSWFILSMASTCQFTLDLFCICDAHMENSLSRPVFYVEGQNVLSNILVQLQCVF